MKKLKIGKSSIQGKGLFSGEPIKKGDLIAKVHSGIQMDPETIKYMPTQYGRFYNHDDKNFNTKNEIIGNHRYLRALKNIPANTELTANYREHPEMEQPEDFGKGKYASFDFDKTIATDEGLAKARQMLKDGYNLFIVSARDKVTPDMVARARKAGIPEENIIATGSDEAKVRKVKQLGVEMHFDDKPEVISELGLVGRQFKKGGGVNSKKYTRSVLGKNKLFVKNKLFKTKKVKNRIYDPNAKYFDNGGTVTDPSLSTGDPAALQNFVYPNGNVECDDDGRCYETDQIQEMLDRGRDIPKDVLDIAWDVIYEVNPEEGPGISASTAWKNRGVQTLAKRLGMSNPANCMWAAGSGWQCMPEFENVPKTAFESNDKFINAVNKGTVPFTRVTKTSDPAFDSKEKGLLQTGDIINLKGPSTSHAMTFSHYREDGMPIYVDSNGNAVDFDFNTGMWSGMKPGNGRVAYVSRFNPEMVFGDKIKELEEKARTNPTYIEQNKKNGGYITRDISVPKLNQFDNGGTTTDVCEDGFAWDEVQQTCVPVLDMKDWFTNWYSNRQLPLDEIGNKKYSNVMRQKLPYYNPESDLLDRISQLPTPTYADIVEDDPDNMGRVVTDKDYTPTGIEIKRSLKTNPTELNATLVHEGSTYLDLPDMDTQFPAQNMVIDPGLVLFEDRWGHLKGDAAADAEEHYNYQTDPDQDNIHSMVFEQRYKRGLTPDQVITEEDITNWKTEAEASGALDRGSKNFDNALYVLLKLAKDNKSLANWFNQLASNDTPVDENAPQYAKQGGSIGYQMGDEVDESTMRKLKKLGYTFKKI